MHCIMPRYSGRYESRISLRCPIVSRDGTVVQPFTQCQDVPYLPSCRLGNCMAERGHVGTFKHDGLDRRIVLDQLLSGPNNFSLHSGIVVYSSARTRDGIRMVIHMVSSHQELP